MQKINRFKKPCFGPIFGPFSKYLEPKKFSRKFGSLMHISYGFLAPYQNLEKKLIIKFPENTKAKGWTDPTL